MKSSHYQPFHKGAVNSKYEHRNVYPFFINYFLIPFLPVYSSYSIGNYCVMWPYMLPKSVYLFFSVDLAPDDTDITENLSIKIILCYNYNWNDFLNKKRDCRSAACSWGLRSYAYSAFGFDFWQAICPHQHRTECFLWSYMPEIKVSCMAEPLLTCICSDVLTCLLRGLEKCCLLMRITVIRFAICLVRE